MRALLALVLAALTGAPACRGKSARAGERGLTYYESYDPRSLDPALSTDVPTGEMVTLAYDGLTQFDADGRLLPGLADRWTAGQDASGRKYGFHLRPGAKFHAGTPLTAAAVRASLLRVLSPATKGGRPWPLYPIAGAEAYAAGRAADVSGITVLGDSSVAFTLTEPLAIFPKFLAMPVASVVPTPPPSDLARPAARPPRAAGDQSRGERAGDPRHRVRRSRRAGARRHPAGARRKRHHAAGVRLRYGGGASAHGGRGVPKRDRRAAVAHRDERGAIAGGAGHPGAAGGRGSAGGAGRARRLHPARGGAQGCGRHGHSRLVGRLPRR